MSDMMDRKLTEQFDEQMEAQWEQRLQQVTNDAEVVSKQADRVMQIEMSVYKQVEKVKKEIQDATTALAHHTYNTLR
jgi:ribosomal protein S17